jgi:hypothetical protein
MVILAATLLFFNAFDNPFDPLESSEEIKGLSCFD